MKVKTNFAMLYAPYIVKDLMKQIVAEEKKKGKALIVEMNAKTTANGVRTQRHWQAVRKAELCNEIIEVAYQRLLDLDEQTSWSDKLDQDRFKFVEKYQNIMDHLELLKANS